MTDEARAQPRHATGCNQTEGAPCTWLPRVTDEARAGEPRRFHGELPTTQTGRNYVGHFEEDTGRWAAAVNLVLAIEAEAAAAPLLDAELITEYVAITISRQKNGLGISYSEARAIGAEVAARLSESAPLVAPLGETP